MVNTHYPDFSRDFFFFICVLCRRGELRKDIYKPAPTFCEKCGITHYPFSTILHDSTVHSASKLANTVAAKLNAISSNQLQQINCPLGTIDLPDTLAGIEISG